LRVGRGERRNAEADDVRFSCGNGNGSTKRDNGCVVLAQSAELAHGVAWRSHRRPSDAWDAIVGRNSPAWLVGLGHTGAASLPATLAG